MRHVRLYETFNKEDKYDLHQMGIGKVGDIDLSGIDPSVLKKPKESDLLSELEMIKTADNKTIGDLEVHTRKTDPRETSGKTFGVIDIRFKLQDDIESICGCQVSWDLSKEIDYETIIAIDFDYDNVYRNTPFHLIITNVEETVAKSTIGDLIETESNPIIAMIKMWVRLYNQKYIKKEPR